MRGGMGFRLQTLKKRSDFLKARNGRYFAASGLVLQAVKGSIDPHDSQQREAVFPRFGFTATKKLGNAVVRNRIKRRLREAVRQIAPQKARPGYEYVLIGRKSTLKRPFSSLLQDLAIAFDRVHGKRICRKKRQERKTQGKHGSRADSAVGNRHSRKG